LGVATDKQLALNGIVKYQTMGFLEFLLFRNSCSKDYSLSTQGEYAFGIVIVMVLDFC